MTENTRDLAGRAYWNDVWDGKHLPPPMRPEEDRLGTWVDRQFHDFFTEAFAGLRGPDVLLCEVGCGCSVWLPYFARSFGFTVEGIDYSPPGVEQSKAILRREGVEGAVHLADLFAPDAALLDRAHVVLSNGVVEHFEDTARALRAKAALARPGGLVVTVVPNMVGAVGRVQRWLDAEVYAAHVPLDVERLRRAHDAAGLTVRRCAYLVATNFGVCNASHLPAGLSLKGIAHRCLVDGSRLIWQLERRVGPFTAGRTFSGYVVCVAERPSR